MSIEWVHQKTGGQLKKKRSGEVTARKIFEVKTTSATLDTPETVKDAVDPATALAVPQIGAQFSATYSGVTCVDVDVQQHDQEPLIYTVVCEYSTAEVVDPEESPLDEPMKVAWSSDVSVEPIYQDRFGQPIENSARSHFDPQPEDDIYDLRISGSLNVASYDPAVAEAALGTVNEDAFTIDGKTILPKKALLTKYDRSEIQTKNGIDYYVLSFELRTRRDTWTRRLLDQGFTEFVGGQKRVILDENQVALNDPVKLNGNGLRLPDGDPSVYISVETKYLYDFNDLDFAT